LLAEKEVGDMTGPQIRDILSRVPGLEIAPEDYGDLDPSSSFFSSASSSGATGAQCDSTGCGEPVVWQAEGMGSQWRSGA
jgi:hypothetical protein